MVSTLEQLSMKSSIKFNVNTNNKGESCIFIFLCSNGVEGGVYKNDFIVTIFFYFSECLKVLARSEFGTPRTYEILVALKKIVPRFFSPDAFYRSKKEPPFCRN